MKLGVTELPGGYIAQETPSIKQVVHSFDWSDECVVTDMGHGPTVLRIVGVVESLAERLAVNAACEQARKEDTLLYFPSEEGRADDHYYQVRTSPVIWTPLTASEYTYEFTATALVPYIYDATTDERVT